MTLFEAARQGDLATILHLTEGVCELNECDENGWTVLHWAAGKGNKEIVKHWVERGADVFKRGEDNRTPYLVALAAGHGDVARYLKQAEEVKGGDGAGASSRQAERRLYTQAFPVGMLRKFPGWEEIPSGARDAQPAAEGEGGSSRANEEIVFLHQNYAVTESTNADERPVFNKPSAEWKMYCAQTLGFKAPADLELAANG